MMHVRSKLSALALAAAVLTLSGCGSGVGGATSRGSALGVSLSASSFDFGSVPVHSLVKRLVVTVTNSGFSPVTLNPEVTGTMQGSLSRSSSCAAALTAGSACTYAFNFAPLVPGPQSGTLNLNAGGSSGAAGLSLALAGTGVSLAPGSALVETTNNPLVASYTYAPLSAGQMSVDFGTSTSYGRSTSAFATLAISGTGLVLVAGMRANTTYHLRASVLHPDGSTETDQDHTFTTSSFPASSLPTLSVTANGTPQPGIELINAAIGTNRGYLQAYATDLQGDLIWGYNYADRARNSIIQPIKLLSNGDFVLAISDPSTSPVPGSLTGSTIALREINLAGDPVKEISGDQLNQRLAAANFNLTVYAIHHDIAVLPNGHWIVIANTVKDVPGTGNVIGDVLIDLDPTLHPVWVWNEFDHLDINRRPTNFPDWTHSNALLYSPSDGNLLLAIRHQGWLIKIDYTNGSGAGDILWRLGAGGDFTLLNGTAPIDWFSGAHQPAFVGPATSGVFSLSMMDNGYHREISPGTYCNEVSGVPCYTSVPIFSIDEKARTATLDFQQKFPDAQYSFFGGGTTPLANGNLEYDLCVQNKANSEVDEVPLTQGNNPSPVWQMKSTGENLYRANRIPSLYPRVQW